MESNHPSPQQQLDALEANRGRVADSLSTPVFYYPLLSLLIACYVVAIGFLPGAWDLLAVAVLLAAIGLLVQWWFNRVGMAPRWRDGVGWTAAMTAVYLGAVLVVVVDGVASWAIWTAALVAAIATLLIGPRYEAAMRRSVAGR